MTDFVLVHGAFHGGWCWRNVSSRLRSAGHTVFTPTLTGLGERHHLVNRETGLETHIEDIVSVIDWEDLHEIVLVGHSYGGAVVGGVADKRGARIKAIVYLDAIVPQNGMSVLDFNPVERQAAFREAADGFNGWQIPPHTAEYYGVRDIADQQWVDEKCVPQPLKCFTEKAQLSSDPHVKIERRGYVLCTDPSLAYMQQFYDWAENEDNWTCHKMDTGHDLMVTRPEELSALLLDYA